MTDAIPSRAAKCGQCGKSIPGFGVRAATGTFCTIACLEAHEKASKS